MSKVYTGATMSIDGYISGPDESGFDHLFQWYGSGEVEMTTTHEDLTFRLTRQSAEHVRAMVDMTGVLVVGRHLFDITSGWGGSHPLDLPVVVVTHASRRLAARRRAVHVRHRGDRARDRGRHGDRRRQGRRRQRRPDRPPVRWRPACSTRSGSTSRRCCSAAAAPFFDQARGRAVRARRAGPGRRGRPRHPPALPRAQGLTAREPPRLRDPPRPPRRGALRALLRPLAPGPARRADGDGLLPVGDHGRRGADRRRRRVLAGDRPAARARGRRRPDRGPRAPRDRGRGGPRRRPHPPALRPLRLPLGVPAGAVLGAGRRARVLDRPPRGPRRDRPHRRAAGHPRARSAQLRAARALRRRRRGDGARGDAAPRRRPHARAAGRAGADRRRPRRDRLRRGALLREPGGGPARSRSSTRCRTCTPRSIASGRSRAGTTSGSSRATTRSSSSAIRRREPTLPCLAAEIAVG